MKNDEQTDRTTADRTTADRATAAPNGAKPRTRVRRMPARGVYDRERIEQILDEALVAHVGFAVEGQPYVIPTLHARVGERLYFHGSSASRTVRALAAGAPACVTVTLLDGLVLARSAVHHSVNYRSVVVFGVAQAIEDLDERREAVEAFTERLLPGRWSEVRTPTEKELRAIQVLSLPLDEASAKIRSGGPLDDEEDYELDAWAGVIPLHTLAGAPLSDERLRGGIPVSPAATLWCNARSVPSTS